jgi:alpha-L-rhamnosidase
MLRRAAMAAGMIFTTAALAAERVPLEITPVEPVRVERRGDTYFADFGQDAYGNLQITFDDDVPAADLIVRLGEKLSPDGTIDRKPPGSVAYREVKLRTEPGGRRLYRLDIPSAKRHGNPAAVHMPPEIGEVAPFRYAEIDGSPRPLGARSLRQLFVHAPFDESAAAFECSDDTLNAVWHLCQHTMQATTAFGLYIDGERERIAYEGDTYINLLSHYACDLDPRVARATFEHLLKFPTWPVEWSLHMPMIAAADYEATGDATLVVQHFDALKKKLLMDRAREDGLLRTYAIVDWPTGERDGYNDGKPSPKDAREVGPEINTVANAFYYHSLRQMAVLAKAIDCPDDAAQFEQASKRVAESFNRVFFDPARGIYLDGEASTHASLHANMFALAFGLVPPERQQRVADFVESRGMACSVYGAQYLLDAMFLVGRDNYAVNLMTSRGDRSWWHMIELGSTMTLEAWDAKAKPNLTWNHAWGAAPANIIARYVLGLRPLTPGYGKVLIAPQAGALTWIRGKVPTPHGPVLIEQQNAGRFKLTVEIPPGVTARVVIPAVMPGIVGGRVSINGVVPATQNPDGPTVVEDVPPGKHVFERL